MATWSGRSDCGVAGVGPSDRILGADPTDDTRQKIELASIILGALAVPIVFFALDRPVNYLSRGSYMAAAGVAVSVALLGAQRFLYILTPHEFSTGNATDVANLAVSGTAVALATVWAAYFAWRGGEELPRASMLSETRGLMGQDGGSAGVPFYRDEKCLSVLFGACRYLSRLVIVGAWLLDVQRREGTVAAALAGMAVPAAACTSSMYASTEPGLRPMARSMSRHCTLPLPSQMELTGDSRNRRGMMQSSMTPLPPIHSMAS